MLTQCSRLSYPVCMSKFQTRRFMTFSTDRICRARVVCHNWKKRCDGTPRTVVVTHTLDSYITRPREYHSTVLHRFNPAFHSGHILSKCKRNRYQIDPIQRRSLSSASEMVLNWMNWVQETWTVDFARKFFIFLHDTVGLPWWLAIISGAVVFRVALLPLGILSIQNQAKIEKLLPETHARAHQIVGDTRWYATVHHRSQQWMQQEIRKNVRQMRRDLFEENNCGVMKPLMVVYLQMPLFISCGLAVRSIAGRLGNSDLITAEKYYQPGLADGGIWWCPDLTMPDPCFILPVLGAVFTVATLEYSILLRQVFADKRETLHKSPGEIKKTMTMDKILHWILRFSQAMTIVLIPILCSFPSCFNIYICTLSSWSIIQVLTLQTPAVKRALGIPKTDSECATPHRDVRRKFQTKYLGRSKDTDKSSAT